MRCIIFICEGAEKTFIFSLLREKYALSGDLRSGILRWKNVVFVFPHPVSGSSTWKGAFKKQETFVQSKTRAENLCKAWGLSISDYEYVILRDVDGINIDNPTERTTKESPYRKAFASARCPWSLSVSYCNRMLETWYIAGVNDSHFQGKSVFSHQNRAELLEKSDAETYGSAKQTFRDALIEDAWAMGNADLMGEILDLWTARQRSKSFASFLEFLEARV